MCEAQFNVKHFYFFNCFHVFVYSSFTGGRSGLLILFYVAVLCLCAMGKVCGISKISFSLGNSKRFIVNEKFHRKRAIKFSQIRISIRVICFELKDGL